MTMPEGVVASKPDVNGPLSPVALGGKVVTPNIEDTANTVKCQVRDHKINLRLIEERKRRGDAYVYGWLKSVFESAHAATLAGQSPFHVVVVISINVVMSILRLPIGFGWAWALLNVWGRQRRARAAHCHGCSARKQDTVTHQNYCSAENNGNGCGCWMSPKWFPAFLKNKRRARNWKCPRGHWSSFSTVTLTIHRTEERIDG